MSDVALTLNANPVSINLGTFNAVSGGTGLTTLKRIVWVSSVGEVGMSNILEGTISGVLTITKTGTTARTVTFPDAAITVARSDAAQTFTGDQTFAGSILAAAISATAAAGVKTQAAATQDAVAIIGRAAGTGSYVASITPPALSASITLTLPAVTGTLAVLGANIFTGAQTLSDVDVVLGTTTGTKIGTAVAQKLGLWNVTPVVQPAAAGQAAAAAQGQASLTDSTGGSASATLAAITAGAAYDQNDLTAIKNALASIAAQLALIKTDVTNVKTLQDATRTALVAIGAMKGAA